MKIRKHISDDNNYREAMSEIDRLMSKRSNNVTKSELA